ncbi:unnamed protein product [Phytomonas sp. Hart1]|nr:unnamed protein product [Phytomonas sp. Hart1]|eukprot:CCW72132.1 unnamed protein product [Phytomonas sp. isolate Hart1]
MKNRIKKNYIYIAFDHRNCERGEKMHLYRFIYLHFRKFKAYFYVRMFFCRKHLLFYFIY